MKRIGLPFAAAALILTAIACGGGAAGPTPAGTPAVTLELSATRSVFDKSQLSVPAGAPYAIHFRNNDTVPHNVSVIGGPPGSVGELFSGPGERTYFFPALNPGSYAFHCDLHPEMRGTITSS